MKIKREDLLLYGITDRSHLGGAELYEHVKMALDGGVTFLQLREKNREKDQVLEEACRIGELCREYNVPFVINDDPEIARLSGANGVHVGQRDMEAGRVREMLGEDKIIGVTARTVEQAIAAERSGADYLGCGAVFPTGSKSDAVELDHNTLRKICEAVNIPVIAIGGVCENNIMELKGSGICGVAVIGAIFGSDDIESASARLKVFAEKITSS